jgi:hypothetical protein
VIGRCIEFDVPGIDDCLGGKRDDRTDDEDKDEDVVRGAEQTVSQHGGASRSVETGSDFGGSAARNAGSGPPLLRLVNH